MARNKYSHIIFGIILIALGVLFLVDSLGVSFIVNWRYLKNFWPMILVFLGLNILFKNSRLWWIVPVLIVLTIITILLNDHVFLKLF